MSRHPQPFSSPSVSMELCVFLSMCRQMDHSSIKVPRSHVSRRCILYKGSGENQFISLQPPVISTVMGNGRRRSISCPSCNGQAQGNKLLAPVALAWGIDGSLYVGDFNFIRRIYPTGNVTSIMELR
ncbi:Teneurin-3 [Xenoophorus captivus]|uniref:Teneurin-3 n=1 Tax=Xenoophorus captivus TaxID=1517983 RepID=A0ABV0RLW4_9TELE